MAADRDANAGLGMAGSWYAATANPAPWHSPLARDCNADLVVIGGGATGLSAALHAAEAGLSVVVLEAGRIGWGASGRNGGQIIPGLRKGPAELVASFGAERGRALFELAVSARALVAERIARHGMACDFRPTGHLHGAVNAGQLRDFEAEVRAAEAMGYRKLRLLSAAAARAAVDTPFAGALLDAGGGHFHSLNYTLGLADAAAAAGAVLHEASPAVRLTKTAAGVTVRTAAGSVHARYAVLAGDALLAGLDARVERRLMPVANYIVATARLPDPHAVIPDDVAVSDARFIPNYYRLTPDGRLMFGGGERYSRASPPDIAAFVRPFLERCFPQLAGVAIDHGWGGLVSITRSRLPDIGRDGPVLWAQGYSGQGAILSTLAGALLAEAAMGVTSRFDCFAGVAPGAFPGGAMLRGPLHVLAMLWYAGRDRIGL